MVCRGLDARDDYRVNLNDEQAARTALLDGIPDDFTRRRTLLKWHAALTALEQANLDMSKEFRDALNETMVLYRIAPGLAGREVNGGPAVGSNLPWAPRYIFRERPEAPVLREIDIPAQGREPARKAYLQWKQPAERLEQAWALTWPDSRVDIFDDVFEDALARNSPRLIGYVLAHEAFHFDQLRNGHWGTINERETEAHLHDLRNVTRFGLTPVEEQLIRERLNYNKNKAERQRRGLELSPTNLPSPAEEAKYKNSWDELGKAFAKIRKDREKLLQELELEREGRHAPAPQEPESIDSLWAAVDSASERLCAEGNAASEDLRDEFLAAIAAMPTNLALPDYDREIVTVTCPRYLANQALLLRGELGAAPDEEWLSGAIAEGRLRQTEPRGRYQRIPVPNARQAPAPVAPVPAQPSAPAPDPGVPDVGTGAPQPAPPDYNHCIDTRCIHR